MSRRACLMSFTVALALALQGASARADFLLGGGYQLGLTNAPSTGTSQQTLDLASAKTVAANLTVTERIIQDGPNAQWVEFSFRTINGGPLAGNLGGTWRIDVLGIDLTAPGLFTDFYSYFSVNGTPFSPINPFFPGSIVAPIPTNPSLGPAFVGAISNPRPLTSIDASRDPGRGPEPP